jgi:2-methylcitrate dehydratase PrpD
MNSTEIAALASKVEIVCDDTTPADYRKPGIPVRVQIELEDGHVLEEIAEVAPGAPQRPLSAEKVTAKFLSLAEPVLGTPAAQQLLGLVDNLEQLDDTARLAELFGKEGG